MLIGRPESDAYRPTLLNEYDRTDAAALARLRADRRIEFSDLRAALRAELDELLDLPELLEGKEADRWVFYPWRRTVIALPGPRTLRAIRLDRNRNKVTHAEQDLLARQRIGIVGLSVGHAVAHTLAVEGVCGLLRLADFDDLELTNLNRVPGTLLDIGVNKAVVAARRIAEIDPYLPVEVFHEGLNAANMDAFLDGLSIVVEECDSLDIKFAVREAARDRRLPVLMETSDRGLLDVERFDLEPDRSPFHGLLGDVRAADLAGLTTREKAPFVARILDAHSLSDRLAASMVEVGETLSSWPQLGSEVQLGGASIAAAVRRIGMGLKLPSGRTRIDLEQCLDELAEPLPAEDLSWPAEPEERRSTSSGVTAVLECAQLAPSGGNTQPWTLAVADHTVTISLAPERSSTMDIGFRASALSVGAALHNARSAASAQDLLGASELITGGPGALTAVLRLESGSDSGLTRDYPALLARHTNRQLGTGAPMGRAAGDRLAAAAKAAGGNFRWVSARPAVESAADLLAKSDRARFLTPRLHEEMFSELRWPGEDPRSGLDVRTLLLAPDELVKLDIGRRSDVMARVRSWSGGNALGESIRDRVLSSSAVAVVTFDAPPPGDPAELAAYARAGGVLQKVWVEAERCGLAVHPVSPVFLFARSPEELRTVSAEFADTLASLQGRFLDLLGVPEQEAAALVLRLSYAADVTVRSRRLPIPGADTCG
ncbi:Rv1355c family protein [Nocardia jejuensis]|uniref:Rv1355c family protein n=1 Tax=Nocardia jejuensis TaxID=328049 RepID=UPI00082982B3|nr:Rv1355c family protein [Nocardia jejuensis]